MTALVAQVDGHVRYADALRTLCGRRAGPLDSLRRSLACDACADAAWRIDTILPGEAGSRPWRPYTRCPVHGQRIYVEAGRLAGRCLACLVEAGRAARLIDAQRVMRP